MFEADLKSLGFRDIDGIECLFTFEGKGGKVFILAYVDDVLVMSRCSQLIQWVKSELMKLYKMKGIGELQSFPGVEIVIDRPNRMIFLSQKGYITKVLKKFGMQDSKPVETLASDKYISDAKAPCPETVTYREALGSLMCLATRIRPDISAAVGAVARHVEEPNTSDWGAVTRIMRYIKGTAEYCLVLGSKSCRNPNLEGYSDADWGSDTEDRKSVSGFIDQVCGTTVSWKSTKQTCVALSTAEVEYISLAEATKETSWLRRILSQLEYPQDLKRYRNRVARTVRV